MPLPTPLSQVSGSGFVGRQQELARLTGWWRAREAGGSQVAFIAGEPGIGKTRLMAHFAGLCHAEHALVLYGRCDEELLVPYQPFVEALRPFVASRSALLLRAQVGPLAGELLRLPGLPLSVDMAATAPPSDPDTERFRLFQAVTALIAGAASEAPVVLMLDDLHWADRSTLLLLRYLVRQTKSVPLFLLGSYRDVEVDAGHPLTNTLADLRREGSYERLSLGGMSSADVASMLTAAVDVGTGKAQLRLADALHERTAGNPFFVNELIRHLDETAGLDQLSRPELGVRNLAIPESVHEVIARRLSRLSPAAHDVLTFASVVGLEFSITILEAGGEHDADELVDAVEELTASGAVRESGDRPLWYSFAHALIRESLYARLSRSRRSRLHLAAGRALETVYGPDPTSHLSELAHHFLQALPNVDTMKAVGYARAAGAWALGQLAYEEAAGHFSAATAALARHAPTDQRARAEVLVELADALWRSGEVVGARQSVLEAAALARTMASPELLARVAHRLSSSWVLSLAGHLGQVATVDEEAIALLEEALDVTPDVDSPLRAQLLGQLAATLYWSPEHDRRRVLSSQAVEMAMRTGDQAAITDALFARRLALWGPDDVEERLRADVQILDLAEQTGDTWRALDARLWRAMDLLELGDVAAADVEIAGHAELAEELRQPEPRWNSLVARAMRALLDGDYAHAELLATEALTIGQDLFEASSLATYGGLMLWAWREQGRTLELEAAMSAILDSVAQLPGTQAGLALTYIDLGREDDARKVFEDLASHDFDDLPRDLAWLGLIAVLSIVCFELGDPARAALLYRLLLPYEERNLVLLNCLCLGPGSYYLGLLAATMGEFDVAAVHYERAVTRCSGVGARPVLASTQAAYATLLAARGKPEDLLRATALLDEASSTAHKLGMSPLAARVDSLRGRLA
jgi:tetratricopeptide (TPR) repeat protein